MPNIYLLISMIQSNSLSRITSDNKCDKRIHVVTQSKWWQSIIHVKAKSPSNICWHMHHDHTFNHYMHYRLWNKGPLPKF
jgi:hypothetical protein